jgi:nitroimidazol reductase NimA-like FMN-containing flavoprotein (pyridoxamine 5'-phosphate oxidase superfamily)
MTPSQLLEFIRTQRLAVQATVGAGDAPQAALVGIAVTDTFELVFDTLDTSRKLPNLRHNPRVAFVIGGWLDGEERTVQYEGVADEPRNDELARIKAAYFETWPDGPAREAWPGLVYVRVRPTWIRHSDFNQTPPVIVEFDERQLRAESQQ